MDTKDRAKTDEGPGPRADERRRAKAYLDLWERHVVLTALDGPAPPRDPASA
jgi:hypothetical protein